MDGEPDKMEQRRYITLPAALKYSTYRNFWLGMFGAVGGFQVLMFGQFWLIHELTGSPLYLGYVGMANFPNGLGFPLCSPCLERVKRVGGE